MGAGLGGELKGRGNRWEDRGREKENEWPSVERGSERVNRSIIEAVLSVSVN